MCIEDARNTYCLEHQKEIQKQLFQDYKESKNKQIIRFFKNIQYIVRQINDPIEFEKFDEIYQDQSLFIQEKQKCLE